MKILRSENRRGLKIGTAGYFTVLAQPKWFPASRLPGLRVGMPKAVEASADESKSVAEQRALDALGRRASTVPSHFMEVAPRDLRVVRPLLVGLAALALASVLLWMLFPA